MNIPNLLSVFRILLIPVLVIFLIDGRQLHALMVFVTAAVTDALDGFIARVFKQKTRIGAYLDPIADKLLISTSYIMLAILNVMPKWLAVIVISRDAIIMVGIGLLLLNDRPIEIRPIIDSKITTFFQLLTVCFYLGYQTLTDFHFLLPSLVLSTAAITIFSGFHYIVIGFTILGKASNSDR